jgi:hypothetical protein
MPRKTWTEKQLDDAIEENETYTKGYHTTELSEAKIIEHLKSFLYKKRLLGYGGYALNQLLPLDKRFYNPEVDIPDLDFYSPNAISDAVELVDKLDKMGIPAEAKSGMNVGTYKVYVKLMPLVDLTQMDKSTFRTLHKTAMVVDGLYYVPVNYLRMSMHQELSRPLGQVSRWTKVYNRLELLNSVYPAAPLEKTSPSNKTPTDEWLLSRVLPELKRYVVLGEFALYFYQHLFSKKADRVWTTPSANIMLLLEEKELDGLVSKLQEVAREDGIVFSVKPRKAGKFVDLVDVVFGKERTLQLVVTEDECVSHLSVEWDGHPVHLANYDTQLSMYYALSYMMSNQTNQLLTWCALLQRIRDVKDPLMERFRQPCTGRQITFNDIVMRRKKSRTESLQTGKDNPMWFKYDPELIRIMKKTKKIKHRLRNMSIIG